MATIKSYTDISQSKKLAEILPIESADMHSEAVEIDGDIVFVVVCGLGDKNKSNYGSPIWSLAALFGVLPKYIGGSVLRMDMTENDYNLWFDNLSGTVDEILPDIIKDNLIDVCVAMIIRLNELNLL